MIYSLLLLITLNGFQTGARANTLPPQLRSPIVSNSTFRLPPQICLDLLGQAALTAPASEALEKLRQLTPESGFANGDHPASRYSRRSKAFLAGRNHLNASEKAILYRDFAERMARASKGTWTAAEYQAFNEHALSRDFVFVGAKQHYLAIRSSDGHVFEGVVAEQPSLDAFLKGESDRFTLNYSASRLVVEPHQAIENLRGLAQPRDSAAYDIALASLAQLKGLSLEAEGFQQLDHVIQDLAAHHNDNELKKIFELLGTFPDVDATQFLLNHLYQSQWQPEILKQLQTRTAHAKVVSRYLRQHPHGLPKSVLTQLQSISDKDPEGYTDWD